MRWVSCVSIWSDRKLIRENETEAVRICYLFLSRFDMYYLQERLLYDVRSEFGNFRTLLDAWFRLLKGDNVRLVEFYEGAYDDRDAVRHESLVLMFLVALVSTILGGIVVEEYKAHRKRISRDALNLLHRCRMSLEYLFDMDALRYLETKGYLTRQDYVKLSRQVKERLRKNGRRSRAITKKLEPYYRRTYGTPSPSCLLEILEEAAVKRQSTPEIQPLERQTLNVPVGAITLFGLAASHGIASGKVKVIRQPQDAMNLKQGDVGAFYLYTPQMASAILPCAGLIGLGRTGSLTGHLAILARAIGRPAVVAVLDQTGVLSDGKFATVDGIAGKIHVFSAAD